MVSKSPSIARSLGGVRSCLAPLEGSTIVVACSGGADSLAMLAMMNMLRRSLRLRLVVSHLDHGLRDESADEGAVVESHARSMGLVFVSAGRLALVPGPGLAARAREARRAALEAVARESSAPWIALGHTATDQVETVLMHLTRGAGLDGLAAMPDRDAPIVRPVLHLARADTRQIASELGLRFIDDPSNEHRDHFRVELRMEVLPRLRAHNPRLEEAVRGMTLHVADAEAAMARWVDGECATRRGTDGGATWSLEGFARLPKAVRLGLLRRASIEMGVDGSELRRSVLEQVDSAAVASAGGARSWDVHPGRRLRLEGTRFWVDEREEAPECNH